jgi:hypothetical protein
VFGNGIRVVWRGDCPKQDEGGGQGVEGGGQAVRVVAVGLEAVDVLLQESREVLARFMVQNDTFGAEAVTESV